MITGLLTQWQFMDGPIGRIVKPHHEGIVKPEEKNVTSFQILTAGLVIGYIKDGLPIMFDRKIGVRQHDILSVVSQQ